MTTTQLAAEIKAVLKPTVPRQLAVTVRKKVLVELLELLNVTSPQPATEENRPERHKDGHQSQVA